MLKFLSKLGSLTQALVVYTSACVLLSLHPSKAAASEARIISLSPSITEIIYELDAESLLVGVSKYCDFPKEATSLPKVGGLYDPSIERILSLRPSIIFSPRELDIPSKTKVIIVNQETLSEIEQSFLQIGDALGLQAKAKSLAANFSKKLDRLKTASSKKTKVLVVVGGHSDLASLYAAGLPTFYNELLELAGAENVYRGPVEFPKLSAEALLTLNPDVIIDLLPDASPAKKNTALGLWQTLPKLRAVELGRVFIFTEEYMVNPGPRVPLILEKFREVIK